MDAPVHEKFRSQIVPRGRGAGGCRIPAGRKEPCKHEAAELRCLRTPPTAFGLWEVGVTLSGACALPRVKTRGRFKSVRRDEGS